MSAVFEPITRHTITDQVRAQLTERIASGELAPGTALPAERTLSEQFGVARTSVREALQGLMSLGLVQRQGNRVHVVEHLPEVAIADPIDVEADSRKAFVHQLFETRRVLELPIFELASVRANDYQRDEIRKAASEFWVGMSLPAFRKLDRKFHTTIAAACGNPLLMEVYGKVIDSLFRSGEFESLLYDEANRARVDQLIERSIRDHHEIASAFLGGDPVAVLAASERHLVNVESRIIDELV